MHEPTASCSSAGAQRHVPAHALVMHADPWDCVRRHPRCCIMQEFFAMCDFVCPDVLGSLSVFDRVFGAPISKSRDRNATAEEKALGEMRSA